MCLLTCSIHTGIEVHSSREFCCWIMWVQIIGKKCNVKISMQQYNIRGILIYIDRYIEVMYGPPKYKLYR